METAGGGCGCGAVTGGGAESGAAGTAYKAAALFGRVYATIGAIIAVIIAIILIVAGYAELRDPHTLLVEGVVTSVSDCKSSGKSTTCVAAAGYVVDGTRYTVSGLEIAAPVKVGAPIGLWYDPAYPQDAVYEISPGKLGWALVGLGLLVGGVGSAVAILTYKYKGFAAGYGVVTGIGALSSAL